IRDFLEANIDIQFTKNMIHAKAVLIDDNISMLGSVNLDIRSLFLNYEIDTFLYSKNDVAKIYRWSEKILADSTQNTQHMIS
ncbi:phospholipase D-like domain-containing protein, partial [Francisella tularensis subsp. holarctica]|uniref:phospholipase D-like domain-containing protein n=1 Tax=Francisella tularensis TaxID=263 RepID=UPI002381C781